MNLDRDHADTPFEFPSRIWKHYSVAMPHRLKDDAAGERTMVPRGRRQIKALFVAVALVMVAFVLTWWRH